MIQIIANPEICPVASDAQLVDAFEHLQKNHFCSKSFEFMLLSFQWSHLNGIKKLHPSLLKYLQFAIDSQQYTNANSDQSLICHWMTAEAMALGAPLEINPQLQTLHEQFFHPSNSIQNAHVIHKIPEENILFAKQFLQNDSQFLQNDSQLFPKQKPLLSAAAQVETNWPKKIEQIFNQIFNISSPNALILVILPGNNNYSCHLAPDGQAFLFLPPPTLALQSDNALLVHECAHIVQLLNHYSTNTDNYPKQPLTTWQKEGFAMEAEWKSLKTSSAKQDWLWRYGTLPFFRLKKQNTDMYTINDNPSPYLDFAYLLQSLQITQKLK